MLNLINKRTLSTAMKTFALQNQLPRLPLPTLEASAQRYLNYIEPLMSTSDFEKTKHLVTDFIQPGNLGPVLHQRLQELDKTEKVQEKLIC